MVETSLEELVEERQFAGLLETQGEAFFRLANTLLARSDAHKGWTKKHYCQLISEADELESFLDDFGARYNRTYAGLTDFVASLRWFAYAGYSVSHLLSRMSSYGEGMWEGPNVRERARAAIVKGHEFLHECAVKLLDAIRNETRDIGIDVTSETFPEKSLAAPTRLKLPRNVGQEDLVDEEQKIAEVATKFLQAAEMIAETGVTEIVDAEERHRFVGQVCTEELARVYEATIHNLQSTYDTHIRNTVLEGRDERLGRLRGHSSAALHLLEAVTYMAHFLERHESDTRSGQDGQRVASLIERTDVERVTVNHFLYWAHQIMRAGTALAEDLLPEYTNVTELAVELPDGVALHARPAALVVRIVGRYGTPVELELGGQRCSAGSILELLVTVGSNPSERRFVFRGDERPLRDIHRLFLHGLGEVGMDDLPAELDYLRQA